jgi:hypothetical protein
MVFPSGRRYPGGKLIGPIGDDLMGVLALTVVSRADVFGHRGRRQRQELVTPRHVLARGAVKGKRMAPLVPGNPA